MPAPNELENSQATNFAAAAVADCQDLMLCVLARLPLKSVCRFKSVCKPWNHLFSTQEFVKMQLKLSKESKNQSFLIHKINTNGSNTISVFSIDSSEKKAKILDHPFSYTHVGVGISIVGYCNGLFCINRGQEFVLLNPAMNLSKTVSPFKDRRYFGSPEFEFGFDTVKVTLSFGYDAEGDDFKVVRILWLKIFGRFRICVGCVEVYSVNSDSWTTIDPGFQFSKLCFCWINQSATVNGNPYWFVKDGEFKDVLICFDMSKLIFKIVPLSSLDYNKAEQDIEFVDLNGSLGALVVTWENGERIEYFDSWVFDDGEQIWTKSHRFGPIRGKLDQVLRCLKDGRVLCKRLNGQLVVFNSKTKRLKGLFNVGRNFKIYNYTASLAYIQGMEKVTL